MNRIHYILVGKPTKVHHKATCLCLTYHTGYQPFPDDQGKRPCGRCGGA